MTLQHAIPPRAARKLAELAPVVVRIAADAVAARRPADATLASHFRAHRELGSRDRRFLADLVFSFFRWRGWVRNLDANAALVLAHRMDAADIHPSIALLANTQDLQPLAEFSLEKKAVAAGNARIDHLVPDGFRDVLYEPEVHFRKCIESFQKRPPTWLRIARRHIEEVLVELQSKAIPYARHAAMPEAVSVTGSPAIASPHVEIQDLASQTVGHICDPKPGESWWDVCAGAGGKSLHLADLMENRGSILATDIRESALTELQRRAKRAGATIITARGIERPAREDFDGVLVDAPCSGIGTWSRNPDARWRTTKDDVTAHAETQTGILNASADAVRVGSRLVYSVCTLTSAETVDVIDSFLNRRTDFVLDGEPRWVWPWEGPCDGMFIAKMRRR